MPSPYRRKDGEDKDDGTAYPHSLVEDVGLAHQVLLHLRYHVLEEGIGTVTVENCLIDLDGSDVGRQAEGGEVVGVVSFRHHGDDVQVLSLQSPAYLDSHIIDFGVGSQLVYPLGEVFLAEASQLVAGGRWAANSPFMKSM